MTFSEKLKKDPDLKSLVVSGWMLLMGLLWFARFWIARSEAIWLFGLDVYKGDEAVDLVKVSVARDGLISLFLASWLLSSYPGRGGVGSSKVRTDFGHPAGWSL